MLALVGVITIVGYLVQLRSPLRLNTDAVFLLRMAIAYQEGRGWNPPDVGSYLPPGYPAMVVVLEKLGMGTPLGLVALNLLFVAVGMWASVRAIHEGLGTAVGGFARLVIGILTLLSWVMIKHATIPLTDVPYFAVSSLSILVLVRAWGGRADGRMFSAGFADGPATSAVAQSSPACRAAWFVLGVVLAVGSFKVRSIGLALFPAAMWAVVGRPALVRRVAETVLRNKLLLFGLIGAGGMVAAGGLLALRQSTYWGAIVEKYSHASPLSMIVTLVEFRCRDLGQVLCAVPLGSLPDRLAHPLGRFGVGELAGLVGWLLVLLGLWRVRWSLSPVAIYFAAYVAILAVWPYEDPRFLLPVLPLIGAFVAIGAGPILAHRGGRAMIGAYIAGVAALGLAAMVMISRVSLAGERFPEVFGNGEYRDSYRAAFGQPHDEAKVKPQIVELINHYQQPAVSRP